MITEENLNKLKSNVIKDSVCGFFIESQPIKIFPPIEAQQPPVAIINAPSIVGSCQDLILESASYGCGLLKYKWKYVNEFSVEMKIGDLLGKLL
jgi:hypothetical protein